LFSEFSVDLPGGFSLDLAGGFSIGLSDTLRSVVCGCGLEWSGLWVWMTGGFGLVLGVWVSARRLDAIFAEKPSEKTRHQSVKNQKGLMS
jgi:phosphate/sulfate permease